MTRFSVIKNEAEERQANSRDERSVANREFDTTVQLNTVCYARADDAAPLALNKNSPKGDLTDC